ncbi:MAG: imidazoleglycerol-phosphate dehydratase HisB [Micrococcales bacterium]|nr:imidazoleglycerol-phosphate dehydratase HisB [Micrococcales bacterium]
MSRIASVQRTTAETSVDVKVNIDGTGAGEIQTGIGFFDHMLDALARHSLMDLNVHTTGDVGIDGHHTIEDTAIAIGSAIDKALGDRAGVTRFGDATVPLDEALARCVIDVSGRGGAWCTGEPDGMAWVRIGGDGVPYAGSMTAHVIDSLAANARMTIHMTLLAGRDPHHIVEAQYKALARALRSGLAIDPRVAGVPSTKGAI